MKKIINIGISSLLLLSAAISSVSAASFPEHPIEVVVPFGAGGTTDVFARAFSRVMPKYLPNEQRIVVVNKPGGASTIGMSAVANADPDGYTVGMLPTGVLEIQPHYGRTNWTLDSFEPIMAFLEIPAAINVHESSPIKTYDEWLTFVKENPNKFTFTTSGGTGSSTHLSMEQYARTLGLKMRHIPFEGHAQSQSAVMSKQVLGSYSLPDIHNGGEIRPIIFLTNVKPAAEVYKSTPTAADIGLKVSASYPIGIVAPKGIPAERAKIIHDAFKLALEDPEIIKFFETSSLPIVYKDAQSFKEELHQRSAQNKEILFDLGLIK